MEATYIDSQSIPLAQAGSVPRVYVNDMRQRELKASIWQRGPAPDFETVQLELLCKAAGQAARMEDLRALAPIGAKVQVAVDGGGEFAGIVASHFSLANSQGESLAALAVQELHSHLLTCIGSFTRISAGKPVAVDGNLSFNRRVAGLCSSKVFQLGSRQARFFSSEASSRPWTVADALGYILATAVPQDVQVQDQDELDSLAGTVRLPEMSVAGLSAWEALERVARRGGLQMRSARQGLGLVLYRPGQDGRRKQVRLQPAGETLSPDATTLRASNITIRRRPWRKSVVARGERKRYESTFALKPGWDPAMQTTRWRDFVRSISGDWELRRDVYRKWVLNEHGWYCVSPWNLPAADLSTIDAGDFLMQAPRRLLPCISTGTDQRSLGIVIEVRLAPTQPWRKWQGTTWTSRDECSLYFAEDALPGDFFQAAAAGTAQVRVTATVEADAKLMHLAQGDDGCGMELVDLASHAKWRKVHSGSIFYRSASLGPPAERDDTAVVMRAAQRRQESSREGVKAQLELGWIDTGFEVGDVIDRIDGRGLDLKASQALPSVISVRHDFRKQTTVLEVQG